MRSLVAGLTRRSCPAVSLNLRCKSMPDVPARPEMPARPSAEEHVARPGMPAGTWLTRNETGVRLFFQVFLTLYLELALIRFASAEVLYLGYFSNMVLVAVFLGIGVGFLLGDRPYRLQPYVPQLLLLLVAFILVVRIDVTAMRESSGQIFFGNRGSARNVPLSLSLPVLFGGTVLVFAAISQETARCFASFRPLVAYTIDIAGSLAGIVLFTVQAYQNAEPWLWFSVSFLVLALTLERGRRWKAVAMGAGVVLLLVVAAPPHRVVWSPYQRVDVWPIVGRGAPGGYYLSVNGIGHQTMERVGAKEPIYDYPYAESGRLHAQKPYRDVLIIGAGSGSDVAYALARGKVARVDAVEIDPEILAAGRQFHPEQPYRDARVRAFATDGRAFMQRAQARYDLILFALPDSLASVSGLSNVRLESFLFTIESFQQAKRLLRDDGVLVLYNYYRTAWLVDKLAGMLEQVFGHKPIVKRYTPQAGGMLAALAVGPRLSADTAELAAMAETSSAPPPSTDNWPFLYMERPHLPTMYWLVMGIFVACGLLAVAATGQLRRQSLRMHAPFLFMGAAFFLLETRSLIEFALLFGATWLVNALVFTAILVSVLLANILVMRWRGTNVVLPFLLLAAALAAQLLIPVPKLMAIQNPLLRYLLASLLLFAPIFFANLAFGRLFRDCEKSTAAFGCNIIGTMLGAALEYTSLAIGYHAQGWIVLGLYVLAGLWATWTLGRKVARPA